MAKPKLSPFMIKFITDKDRLMTVQFDEVTGIAAKSTFTPTRVLKANPGYVKPAVNEIQICKMAKAVSETNKVHREFSVTNGMHASSSDPARVDNFQIIGSMKIAPDKEFGDQPYPAHAMLKATKKNKEWQQLYFAILTKTAGLK